MQTKEKKAAGAPPKFSFPSFRAEAQKRKDDPRLIRRDLCVLVLSFLFSRTHLIFGSYPLGLAFLCVLPSGIVAAAVGGIGGALSMGKSGIIYAVSALVCVCIRAIISSSGDAVRFREPVSSRLCAGIIGGFVSGVYTVLLHGLTLSSVTYSVSQILLPGLLGLCMSGIFYEPMSPRRLLWGKAPLALAPGEQKMPAYLFEGSFLVFFVLILYSLDAYSLLGFSFSYLCCAIALPLFAKRFGAVRAMALGFFGVLLLSPTASVAFALSALVCGFLFRFGDVYALIGGGFAVTGWCFLAGGLPTFLAVFPEYCVGALFAFPLCRKLPLQSDGPSEVPSVKKIAADMVGTMVLSQKSRAADRLERVECALDALAPLCERAGKEFAGAERSSRLAGQASRWIAGILSETRCEIADDFALSDEKSAALREVFASGGFSDGVVCAYGTRRPRIVGAAEDADGTHLTASGLKSAFSDALGVRLAPPTYYRKENMVLFESRATPRFRVSVRHASIPGTGGEECADSFVSFSSDDVFYACLSDGMGCGAYAKSTSAFATAFLKQAFLAGSTPGGALRMLNAFLSEREEECSTTVDLFLFDCVLGEGYFIKCGAAASYIKRAGSVYRIRSSTAPLGILERVDAEQIRVEVGATDRIFLFTDGVFCGKEGLAKASSLLSGDLPEDPDALLAELLPDTGTGYADDRTVAVIEIGALN